MIVGWTPERTETLRTMYAGGSSASEIARTLGGVTRNAVIGKCHRLGLTNNRSRAIETQRQAKALTKPSAPVCVSLAAVITRPLTDPGLPPFPEPLTATARDAGRGQCRWPIGDPQDDDYGCCGRSAAGRYCATHEAMGRSPRQAPRNNTEATATYCTRNERRECKPPAPRPLGILGDRWVPDW